MIAPEAPIDGTSRAEDEARRRPGCRAGQVEGQEPQRSVPALDDRARDVQREHVEDQVERIGRVVEERHRPEPPVLAGDDARLAEPELRDDRVALAREHDGQRDDGRDRDDHQGHRQPASIASALGEIALRGPGVAGLLVEPAEPVGDLRLVLARRQLVGFAVGLDRAGQVAVTNPGGGHVAPGRIGRRRLGQLRGRPATSGPRPARC